jgi:octaprenyl-diphosphate synthase
MELKLDDIKRPIAKELDEFEIRFRENMRSNAPLLDRITHYIVTRKGKQMRPMFVFLSARLCGEINEVTYIAASLVEILHTATLVHDDVVDDSYQRRGYFSINALWKNKIAVLVGDYLLAKGLLLSVENNQYRLLQLLSNTIREMSEGELLQLE